MTVVVAVGFLCGIVGLVAWQSARRERAAAEFTAATLRVIEAMHATMTRAGTDSNAAHMEAMTKLAMAAVAPQSVEAGGGRTYSETEIARELYEQGIVPTFNDPTDDTDPTDTDRWLQVARADVATADSNDPEPFGVPGVGFTGPQYGENVVQFPPPQGA